MHHTQSVFVHAVMLTIVLLVVVLVLLVFTPGVVILSGDLLRELFTEVIPESIGGLVNELVTCDGVPCL